MMGLFETIRGIEILQTIFIKLTCIRIIDDDKEIKIQIEDNLQN